MKVDIVAVAILGLTAIGGLGATVRAHQTAPPKQARAASAATPSHSVWDGVYTDAQAKRGAAVYLRECSSCHGESLRGGEGAPGLTGAEFSANWNGQTLGDLFAKDRTMPPPPDNPERLTRQQHADLLAYILNFNEFPVGKTELANETEQLKRIRIDATKP